MIYEFTLTAATFENKTRALYFRILDNDRSLRFSLESPDCYVSKPTSFCEYHSRAKKNNV
ncbi:unnamed protein product [Amoebophrya sp. A25]|nr:unnamed protein product [Amoebophrya sp. A25]|eukprot:GSA25T00011348001.1